ncbi:MAG: type II toxin-antitoxin system VapC family toxin [Thermoflexales bacterium]|nr:type II toxin-antitoxin system VapC family toxin [Thermoflexales bacterium]
MATYYLDASALVKYYILEPGSTWVRELVDVSVPDNGARANSILVSEASIAECAAAFAVLFRTRRISLRARDGAFRAFMHHLATARFHPIRVLTEDFYTAAHLTQRHPLKAYDAVQLAVALRCQQVLASFPSPSPSSAATGRS